ncbi:hypothetical protein D3C81_1456430 [compost metagenome]
MLQAEYAQLLRRRANEGDTGGFAGFGEGGVLGEEAVAGMDGGGAAFAGGGEDLVDHQVGAGGGAFAEAEGFVGLLDVQAGGVGFGVDGDAAYAQFMKSTQDAAGDGAAVGDQEFFEHEGILMSGGPSRRYSVSTTVVRGRVVGAIRGHGPLLRLFRFQALPGAALAQQEQPAPNCLQLVACRLWLLHSHTRSSAGVGL